jgi:hypothetical protein
MSVNSREHEHGCNGRLYTCTHMYMYVRVNPPQSKLCKLVRTYRVVRTAGWQAYVYFQVMGTSPRLSFTMRSPF